MKLFVIALFGLALASCKTTSQSQLKNTADRPDLAIWQQHVSGETSGKNIQGDCMPRHFPAEGQKKGVLVFFHGFSACPQQYFDIGGRLAKQGFDVFLPLNPGHGRVPSGKDDNLSDLPSDRNNVNKEHTSFVELMNKLALANTAPLKVVAGLSGGGSLATGAVITGPNIWDRALIYAPYYKNPKTSGPLSAIAAAFNPNIKNDWGDKCRAVRDRGRAGFCSVTVGSIRAMTNYGIWASDNIDKIKIPVQFVGVDHDPTADNRKIKDVYEKLKGQGVQTQICLFPEYVPHSIINPRHDEPDLKADAWVPMMQEDSINFITSGKWYPAAGKADEYGFDACRFNHDVLK